jgi:putative CocE/NonD family hydrolase
MSIISRLARWILELPPAESYDVIVKRDIRVPMPDGIYLLADRYYPRKNSKSPLVLVRSPYGRRLRGFLNGRLLAEHGFQVLIQSCRGTFGSGGKLDPHRQERADGLATIEWMKKQEWFPGNFATFGASYLGHVQWAISDSAPELKAMVVIVSCSDLGLHHHRSGSFTLEDALMWTYQRHMSQEQTLLSYLLLRAIGRTPRLGFVLRLATRIPSKVKRAFQHLPPSDLDQLVCGEKMDFWQNFIEHDSPNDEWWKTADHREAVPNVTAPVLLVGGWYDIFLPWQLRDYRSLCEAGRKPHLLIGPWSHIQGASSSIVMREGIDWLRAHLLGDQTELRTSPVRLFIMGANEWRNFSEWPPHGYQPKRWYLQPNGKLATELPPDSKPDHYRYDPTDPTPAVGGPRLPASDAGPKDNRALEARSDVLTYTSARLDKELEVVGPVQAELYVKSSLQHTDFLMCLCDVYPSGMSINICDGLVPVRPTQSASETDEGVRLSFDLWPTAYRFGRDHYVRVHVCSGAHPRYIRNTGSGEPLAKATKLLVAEQEVHHDPYHPSAIILST